MPKTIKIDQYRYMTNESWRILLAVEMGMKNHEFVPPDLVHKISRCTRRGSSFLKILRDDLVPHGLLAYETDARKGYSGYRLTNLGYDYLALHTLIKSGQILDLGSMIGAGKESDVYLAVAGDACGFTDDIDEKKETLDEKDANLPSRGDYIVIKFHRLGRTSFRKVREKREYHQGRNACSWLYLDRLAAKREYDMMKVLYDFGLPVPRPLANNRNCVVMGLLSDAIPLCKILPATLRANDGAVASCLYSQSVEILNTITRNGLVHGDFNEFNLLVGGLTEDNAPELPSIDGDESTVEDNIDLSKVKLILIDFPQMISRHHQSAQEIYERDLGGITSFFGRYLELDPEAIPPTSLLDIPCVGHMDVELRAPGYQQPTKTKGGRGVRYIDDSDLLVGNVAALALDDCDEANEDDNESSQADEEEFEDHQIKEVSGESGSDTSSEGIDGGKNENVSKSESLAAQSKARNSSNNMNKKAASQTIIGLNDVRERRRREEKRRAQNEIRLRVKRQQRASAKNQGRADIATEARLFD